MGVKSFYRKAFDIAANVGTRALGAGVALGGAYVAANAVGLTGATTGLTKSVKDTLTSFGLTSDQAGIGIAGLAVGAAALGTARMFRGRGLFTSKVDKFAVKYGREFRDESRNWARIPTAQKPEQLNQEINKKLNELRGQAFKVAAFYSSGFTEDGNYTGNGREMTVMDEHGDGTAANPGLNPAQRSELAGIRDAEAKIKASGLSVEELSSLSQTEVDAIALKASKPASRHSLFKGFLAVTATAAVADQVFTGGMFRQDIANYAQGTIFETPTAKLDQGLDWFADTSAVKAFSNGAGKLSDFVMNKGIDLGADIDWMRAGLTGASYLGLSALGAKLGNMKGGVVGGLTGMFMGAALAQTTINHSMVNAPNMHDTIVEDSVDYMFGRRGVTIP